MIKVSVEQRSKRKSVTVIVGLRTCGERPLTDYLITTQAHTTCPSSSSPIDIDLKTAAKCFATHFSCGSSVTGEDEVVVQGDVCDNVISFIQSQWPEVRDSQTDMQT